MSNYLRLKKNNYLAIITFTGIKKMIEVVAKDEDEAYEKASNYATNYCKAHGYLHFNPVIVKIPDKLQTGDVIEAWTYDTGIYKGISVGAFDKMCGNSKPMVSVESVNSADGIVDRIVINKTKAEKHGFRIVINETE